MIAVLPSMIHPKTAVLGRAGGGNLSDIHRVTLFLRSTFYHLFPQRYNFILKQTRKSGESFEKKYSGGFMASGVLSRK